MAVITATLTTILFEGLVLFLFNLASLPTAAASQQSQTSTTISFDWAALEPSSDLRWHDCYSPLSPPNQNPNQHILSSQSTSKSRTFSCARLSLPLDYHNLTNPHNISVPLLKVSSPPSSSHRGTIIIAPGGAGNSRIQSLLTLATESPFLQWIDPDFEYDFLTFDNRGFGYSSPDVKCFDNELDSKLFEEKMADLGDVMSTKDWDEGLQVRLAAAKAKGNLCAKQSGQDGDVRRHMTTAYAARDMLEILMRLSDHSTHQPKDRGIQEYQPHIVPRDQGHSRTRQDAKLNFLGLSYGTMVGQTFASMYPEHVSRMVLDGTGDGKDWMAKWQMQHLIDTDAVWNSLYVDCFEAKEDCPLWRMSDPDSATIGSRIEEFVGNLKQRPVYTVSDGNARLITYRDVKLAMYWTTMTPSFAAPDMATMLDRLMRGHTNVTLDFPFGFEGVPTTSDCPEKETQDSLASYNSDAGPAINCGDAEDITNSTIDDFKEYLSALENQSSIAAFFQGERKIRCMGWPIRPAWRFTGPFTSKKPDGTSKLSTPLLFLGNRLDPMTSLYTARKVVKDYPGSVVLEQNARGHCALGNTIPSSCTLGHVRAYFRDGVLPERGTVCGEECNWFDGSCFDMGEENSRAASLNLQRILGH